MPSLIDIRRRIRAVKSTQQITKAMKMVSASKLRRAQERILRGRPYASEMLRLFNHLATRVDQSAHPLLTDDPASGRTLLVVITADRGLCGSFNTNVVKARLSHMADQPQGSGAATWPWPGRPQGPRLLHAPRLRRAATKRWASSRTSSGRTRRRSPGPAIDEFLAADVEPVYLVYNEFKSVIQQRVVVEKLLPIPRASRRGHHGRFGGAGSAAADYLYEPDAATSCSRRCCRSTWPCRCTARCSSRRRPSTPRACRRWTRPRATRRT